MTRCSCAAHDRRDLLERRFFLRCVYIAVSLKLYDAMRRKKSLCVLELEFQKLFHSTIARYHESGAAVSYFISCKQLTGDGAGLAAICY